MHSLKSIAAIMAIITIAVASVLADDGCKNILNKDGFQTKCCEL